MLKKLLLILFSLLLSFNSYGEQTKTNEGNFSSIFHSKSEWVSSISEKVKSNLRYQEKDEYVTAEVYIVQDRNGNVMAVDVRNINVVPTDRSRAKAIFYSIESAVRKSSPLPYTSNDDVFNNEIIFKFFMGVKPKESINKIPTLKKRAKSSVILLLYLTIALAIIGGVIYQGFRYQLDGIKFKSKEDLESYKKLLKKSKKELSEAKIVKDVKAESDGVAVEMTEAIVKEEATTGRENIREIKSEVINKRKATKYWWLE